MTGGVLVLLFVAFQLWGTGILEARSQDSLRDQFDDALTQTAEPDAPDDAAPAEPTQTTEADPNGGVDRADPNGEVDVVPADVAPRLPIPDYGDPVGEIRLPTIGVTRVVVSGIGLDQLARGPGHYPESPLPGQEGNVAIAGHRTTFGQPFHNVDQLEPGDQIFTTTVQGEFVYEVEGTEIVQPDEVRVLEDQGDNRMTLIACHPKYSLAQRIIVHAVLVGSPAPEIDGQGEARLEAAAEGAADPFDGPTNIDEGLSGASEAVWPAVLWGLACAAVWFVTSLVQRFIRRRQVVGARERRTIGRRLVPWSPYLAGVPIFLVTLFVFFAHTAVFLPANY
jgi:sortase A